MDKENKNKLEALLEKVANEQDLEIYDLNIQTSQNPIVIQIIIRISIRILIRHQVLIIIDI